MVSLEQRLDSMEQHFRAEIKELRSIIERTPMQKGASQDQRPRNERSVSPSQGSSTGEIAPSTHLAQRPVEPLSLSPDYAGDIVSSGILTEDEWTHFLGFFLESCRHVVAILDDEAYSSPRILRRHSLMSTVICTIAARAIKQESYEYFLAKADNLIKNTFDGPPLDTLDVHAMMLLAAWTGRTRLWGYIASIAGELKLDEAALQLGSGICHTEDLHVRARTWLSLCCFDLL